MIIYILLLLFLIGLTFINDKTYAALCLVFTSGLILLRIDIGIDYEYYYDISTIEGRNFYFGSKYFEFKFENNIELFNLLSNIVIDFELSPLIPILFFDLTGIIILIFLLKKLELNNLALLLWILIPFGMFMSMSLTSQFLSTCLMYLGFYFYNGKRNILTIIILLLSFITHSSSALFIVLFYGLNKLNVKFGILLVIGIIILFDLIIVYVPNFTYFDYYVARFSEEHRTGGSKLMYTYIVLLVIYIAIGGLKSDGAKIIIPSIVLFIFMNQFSHVGVRSFYTAFPFFIYEISKNYDRFYLKDKLLIKYIIILFSIINYLYYLNIDKDKEYPFFVPYKSYLSNN